MELICMVLVSGKQYLKIQVLSLYECSECCRTCTVFFSIPVFQGIPAEDWFSYLVNYTTPQHTILYSPILPHVCYSDNIIIIQAGKNHPQDQVGSDCLKLVCHSGKVLALAAQEILTLD